MKEKVVLAYSGGRDTDRAKNWMDWKKEPNFPVQPNYILKIS